MCILKSIRNKHFSRYIAHNITLCLLLSDCISGSFFILYVGTRECICDLILLVYCYTMIKYWDSEFITDFILSPKLI